MKIFLDTETCGLVGPIVLIQYSRDHGPVILHDVWTTPVKYTLKLLEHFCDNDICAYNLAFDWFHINKLYNIFKIIRNQQRPPRIEEAARICESQPRRYCLKPASSLDLMLTLRKSELQTLMPRKPIKINKVPEQLAEPLAHLLTVSIPLPDIYFHKRPGREYRWLIEESDPGFKNLILKFGPSSGLKPVIKHLFPDEEVIEDAIPYDLMPEEDSYNPYDTRWADVIEYHIKYWRENERAREYATRDIDFLCLLYSYFNCPEFGDIDSELAACVGAVRWRGYTIDEYQVLKRWKENAQNVIDFKANVCNFDSQPQTLKYLHEHTVDVEKLAIKSTDKETLKTLGAWSGEIGNRARKISEYRKKAKELDILRKLATTKRFNPEFKVIGTKSSRMSGGSEGGYKGGSLNPQGIKRDTDFRKLYTLAEECDQLSGGDFAQFEVTIADAAYNDAMLRKRLESGKSFPALLGEILYDESYDEIMASKGTEEDLYTPAKNTTYGLFYGAHERKLAETAGIDETRAEQAMANFYSEYTGVLSNREYIFNQFCSMRQLGGLGSPITWHEPADFITSLLGFRRYFTLENQITRALFELAQNLPREFNINGQVQRRKDRTQTPGGATRSALYASAFQLQASNMRAACNHVIQSTGATITKTVQARVWTLQPSGIAKWSVQPMNNHDEIMVVHKQGMGEEIEQVVQDTVEEFRNTVPLLSIDWKVGIKDWSEK